MIPVLVKVLEKVQISLKKSAFTVTGNQHAFTQGRSTVSALINITQSWFNDTDNSPTGRNGIHALFLEFRKAFDLIDHSILLSKLKAKNINKSLWLWIQSFLSSRTQQVKLPSTVSTIRPCPAGVPQGCVISPSSLISTSTTSKTQYQVNCAIKCVYANMLMTAQCL